MESFEARDTVVGLCEILLHIDPAELKMSFTVDSH